MIHNDANNELLNSLELQVCGASPKMNIKHLSEKMEKKKE